MTTETKFCKDCKHCMPHFSFGTGCRHPSNGYDSVTGELNFKTARANRSVGICGAGARLFELKLAKPTMGDSIPTQLETGFVGFIKRLVHR